MVWLPNAKKNVQVIETVLRIGPDGGLTFWYDLSETNTRTLVFDKQLRHIYLSLSNSVCNSQTLSPPHG